jgi:3-polyprenyl-4-hydroxybenzoate decarboxylase
MVLKSGLSGIFRLVVAVDHTVDVNDKFMVAWQALGNSDPVRDHILISPFTILIDGTIKFYRDGGFARSWPNIVCSDPETIKRVDEKWNSLGFDSFISSPSLTNASLVRKGTDKIIF